MDKIMDSRDALVDATVPSPHTLEVDLLVFRSALGNLELFSRDSKRPLAELAADADMASTWGLIHERISGRAHDFHSMEAVSYTHLTLPTKRIV